MAKIFQPDLILCDIDMPDLSGYDVLKELQRDPNLNSIPFVFCTSSSGMENRRKGMDLGAGHRSVKA